jgi:hypothetical protein
MAVEPQNSLKKSAFTAIRRWERMSSQLMDGANGFDFEFSRQVTGFQSSARKLAGKHEAGFCKKHRGARV